MNCQKVGNDGNDSECGYFLLDPTGRLGPGDPPPPCLFFLKLVHSILSPENEPSASQAKTKVGRQKSPWKDDVVAPWFTTVNEFYLRFTRQTLNFGCVITDKDNETCDITNGRFRPLTLSPDYVLVRYQELDKARSGIKSLIFIHDFCIMVHAVTFDTSGNVKGNITFDNNGHVKGMGRKIPDSKRQFKQYIHDVQVSLFQLIDRIASTQFGSVWEETDEYKKYLHPGTAFKRWLSMGGMLKMPKPEDAFPDLAKYLGWKPLSKTPVLVGTGEEECQMNDGDLEHRLRKPRTRNKDKNASGEGQLVDSGKRKQPTNPSLTKSPARRSAENEGMHDGAHTTAGVSQGSEFVPFMEHLAPFIPSFEKEFQNATSEEGKKSLCWQVLALVHGKSPLPLLDDALTFIRDNLEKKEESVLIVETLGEKDVLCGQGKRKCIPYIDRTEEFKDLYSSTTNRKERNEVVSSIYITLKKEGFRFLEETDENGLKEKKYDSGMDYVRMRMNRLCHEKEGEDNALLAPDALEAIPGPFESASLPRNGIVLCKEDEPKDHEPNAVFRRTVQRARVRFESGTDDEKTEIVCKVIEDMETKGYIFVKKEENVWKDEKSKEIKSKVRRRIRKSVYFGKQNKKVAGKRKAGDDDDAAVVATSKLVPNDNNTCIECNEPSNHSCEKCNKSVCSVCCSEKRGLEMVWWCDVCFKTQSLWNQRLIREGNYSSSDEE